MARMRRLLASVLTILLLLPMAPPASAAETLDQSQTQYQGFQYCKDGYACAQVFTADQNGGVARVRLAVDRGPGVGDMVVQLRSLVSGLPTGTTLASQTVPAASVPEWADPNGTPTWIDVTFPAPGKVEFGKQYAIYVGATGTAEYHWYNAGDVYAGGTEYLQDDQGTWGPQSSFDFAFETYVVPLQDNARLSDLSLSQGNLTPAFAQSTYSYSATVSNSVTALVVTPTTDDPAATVKVNGNSPTTPVNLAPGLNNISVVVTAPDGITKETYTIAVTRNILPTVTGLSDQTIAEDTQTAALPFTIGDAETPVANLTVSATSLTPSIVPVTGITLGGTGADRVIRVTPAPNAFGTATIQVQVGDGTDVKNQEFKVNVTPVSDPPTIGAIANQTAPEDGSVVVNFTVGDPDGSLSTLQVSAQSNNQLVVPNDNLIPAGTGADRTLTIVPVAQTGSATISVFVTDGTTSVNTTFTLTILPVNDAPIVQGLSNKTIPEDSPEFAFSFSVSDEETPAGDLTITLTSSNTALVPHQNATITNTNGTVTATLFPLADQTGSTTITVTVSDGEKSTTGSFVLTVVDQNDPPELGAVSDQSTQEDTVLGPISLVVSDPDSPVENLQLTATSSNTTLVPNANIAIGGSGGDRTITITPAKDQTGETTITLRLNDGLSQATRTFKLTVTGVNDPPTVSEIPDMAVAQDTPITPLTFTISDPETPATSLMVNVTSSNQALVPNSNLKLSGTDGSRTLSITPATFQAGTTTITITVSDGYLTTSESFILTIAQRPTLTALSDVITDEDSAVGPLAFTIGDLETPADQLVVTAISSNSVLVPAANLVLGGSGTNRNLTITPAQNQFGQAVITVTVSDGVLTNSRSFLLTVNPVEDPPTISPINDVTVPEDTSTGPIAFQIIDPDTPLGNLAVTATSSNDTLVPPSAIFLGGYGADRTITVIPANEQSGVAIITVTVSDGKTLLTESFVLTVSMVDDPPRLFAPPNPTVVEDSSTSFEVTATDVDSPLANLSLSVTAADQMKVPNANIWVSPQGAGKWLVNVTPAPNQSGTVPLRLSATGGGTPMTQEILLTIIEVNDPPTISAIANQITDEDVTISGIGFVIGDLETPPDNLKIFVSSDDPVLLPTSSFVITGSGNTRSLSITPAADKFGSAGVFITVDDGGVEKVVRSFNLIVNPIPDPPRLKGISDQTIEEDQVLKLPVVVYDPDSPISGVTFSITSNNQALVPDSNIILRGSTASRTLEITPTKDWSGIAQIRIVSSGDGLTSEQVFTLTVEPKNDAPFISQIPDLTILEGESTGLIGFTIGDIESPAAILSVTATSSNQEIVPDEQIELGGSGPVRTITVFPAADQYGTVTITITVDDGEATAKRSFKLNITSVNDPPAFVVGPDVEVEEDEEPQSIKNWATGITAGPFEQQGLAFELEVENPSLFAVAPHVTNNGTLTFTTALHAFGETLVQIRLRDDGGIARGGIDLSDWQTFKIVVTSVNDLPVISEIPDQGTEESVPTEQIPFTVSDVETVAAAIQVTATSSNTELVPPGSIRLGGLNGDRWVQITPAPGRIGTTIITLTASDGEGSSKISFPLIVNNLRLSALVPSVGEFTPPFHPHTLSYADVYNGTVTEVTLTPVSMDPDVVIRVNGVITPSGTPSAPIHLGPDGGDAEVEVRAPVTGLSKLYRVHFARALSSIRDLADLSLSQGALSPDFHPEVTSYSATVDWTITAVTVNYRPADGRAKVTVMGNTNLAIGANLIKVLVVAENGEEKLYTINLTREAPPLGFDGPVTVEAGAEWTTLRFQTSEFASITVYYRPTGSRKEQNVTAPSGKVHNINLGPLSPGTTYEYSIVAQRTDQSTAHHTSFFTTADPAPISICKGGEIKNESPGVVTVRCPGDDQAADVARAALREGKMAQVSVTPIAAQVMTTALQQAGLKEPGEEPGKVAVRTDPNGQVQGAVIDGGAMAQLIRSGASLEVRSPMGSLTLPPAVLAPLMEDGPGRLVILMEEVPADREDVKPWVNGTQVRLASAVVDLSVATVYDDGTVVHHTHFTGPLRLTLRADRTELTSPDLLGIHWLKEAEPGKVVDRVYQGSLVTPDGTTVSAQLDHLSLYAALFFEGEFKDVPRTHWAYSVIQQMAARQVIRGKSPDLFEPEMPVTRGQIAAMLVRALRLEKDPRFAQVYTDIQQGDALAPEIGGAILAGLMMGYPDGTFRPEARITRQELAVVLSRLSIRLNLPTEVDGNPGGSRLAGIKDWDTVAPWAKEAVRAVVAQGLMTGRSSEAFAPDGITTRAEAATVVKRLLDWIDTVREP